MAFDEGFAAPESVHAFAQRLCGQAQRDASFLITASTACLF
jgi:hypothetical protein